MARDYWAEYKSKLRTPEQVAAMVESEWVVNYGAFNIKSPAFDKALGARAGEPGLEKVYVKTSNNLPPTPAVITNDPEQKTFQVGCWFLSALDRYWYDQMLLDFLPLNYHDTNLMSYWPDKTWSGRRGDLLAVQVGPMDKHGNFNFGIMSSDVKAKCYANRYTVVEVNENIPNVLGGLQNTLHISEVDFIIEGENPPLFTVDPVPPNENERKIAEQIMTHIHDGCCLQLGIGPLPNTIGDLICQSDLKDLGLHAEMFCTSMMNMHELGMVNNSKKQTDRFKSVFSFAFGSAELYEFIDNNPLLASYYIEYVNMPWRIAQNENVISVNNTLQVDLLTQANSESIGPKTISGAGGQLDWVNGAFDSKGGKSFLAFESTYVDKDGNLKSRIVPTLEPGTAVTVPRHTIHWVVTEYGMTNLKGLSTWERAEEMVRLAHPKFRDELLKEAQKLGIWKRTNRRALDA
jgi:acyl-CoA hydrolase